MKEVIKKSHRYLLWLGLVVLLLIGYVIWVFQFSYPSLSPKYIVPSFTASSPAGALPFPSYGQSAVGINSYGAIAQSGSHSPAPIASVAKLITALSVLQKYPITNVNNSPVITLSQSDVDLYNSYLFEGGSVAPVVAGEKITEYQMIEAMLLPSANNMADSLAIWAFGSLANYSIYANNYLKSHDLTDSHAGVDASGYDPSTTSTASDLIKMGQIVIANPILSQMVAMKSVDNIPVAGTLRNVNTLLGLSNINGIKTGNTAQAGGVYLSSSVITVNNVTYNITTAVMGAPTLWNALNDSYKLVTSAQANFAVPSQYAGINTGSIIGSYSVPWSKDKIFAVANSNLPLSVWKGNPVKVTVGLNSISNKSKSGANVGIIIAKDTRFNNSVSTKVQLISSVPAPSRWWLLLHPEVSLQL